MLKKFRRQDGLRYYLYVSDIKLDMLFDHVGEQHRKNSVELKIDTAPGQGGRVQGRRTAEDELPHHFLGRGEHRGPSPATWHAPVRGTVVLVLGSCTRLPAREGYRAVRGTIERIDQIPLHAWPRSP